MPMNLTELEQLVRDRGRVLRSDESDASRVENKRWRARTVASMYQRCWYAARRIAAFSARGKSPSSAYISSSFPHERAENFASRQR